MNEKLTQNQDGQKTSSNLWFKRKKYGWGWTPCNWKGWLSTLVYALLVIAFAQDIKPDSDANKTLAILIGPVLFVTALFLLLAYKKGETPKWQWGDDTEDTEA